MFRKIPILAKAWSPGSKYLRAGCGMGSVLNAAQSIKEKTSTLQVEKLPHSHPLLDYPYSM
jgi:hypothetical protein